MLTDDVSSDEEEGITCNECGEFFTYDGGGVGYDANYCEGCEPEPTHGRCDHCGMPFYDDYTECPTCDEPVDVDSDEKVL